jgi:hypothetical protein
VFDFISATTHVPFPASHNVDIWFPPIFLRQDYRFFRRIYLRCSSVLLPPFCLRPHSPFFLLFPLSLFPYPSETGTSECQSVLSQRYVGRTHTNKCFPNIQLQHLAQWTRGGSLYEIIVSRIKFQICAVCGMFMWAGTVCRLPLQCRKISKIVPVFQKPHTFWQVLHQELSLPVDVSRLQFVDLWLIIRPSEWNIQLRKQV